MKKNFLMLYATFMIVVFGGGVMSCGNDDEEQLRSEEDFDIDNLFSPGKYDFEVNGIYYNVISTSELTCEVVRGKEEYKDGITIPETVSYNDKILTIVRIGEDAFRGCSHLTGITIPNNIQSIGNSAFTDCYKLERVNIEDGETTLYLGYNSAPYYYDDVFYRDRLFSENGLFYDCPITTLYIGRSLSYNANSGNGFSPFYTIETLKELTIGNSVTTIFSEAFQGCNSLTTLYSFNITPPEVPYNGWGITNNQYMTMNVFVPQEALEAYQKANVWKNFWNLQGFDAAGIENVKTERENGTYL